MPVLSPKLLATWYYLVDSENPNNIILAENYEQNLNQDIKSRPMIQGDIGVHAMDVGGIKYTTTISSPILIVETNSARYGTPTNSPTASEFNTNEISNSFGLLINKFNEIRYPDSPIYDPTNPNPIVLKSGRLNISEEAVSTDMTFVSGFGNVFSPVYVGDSEPPDFIARTARWYDTGLVITEYPALPIVYPIIEASLNFEVDIEENYFMGTGQTPFFSVQGYKVSGSLKVLAPPNDQYLSIAYQNSGDFSIVGYQNLHMNIGGITFDFGAANMTKNIKRSLTPNKITSIEIEIETFARYTTPFG